MQATPVPTTSATRLGTARLFVAGASYQPGFKVFDVEIHAGRTLATGVRDIPAAYAEITKRGWGDGGAPRGLIGFVRTGATDAWNAVELLAVAGDGRRRTIELPWDLDALRIGPGVRLDAIWQSSPYGGDTQWGTSGSWIDPAGEPGAPATMPAWPAAATSTN